MQTSWCSILQQHFSLPKACSMRTLVLHTRSCTLSLTERSECDETVSLATCEVDMLSLRE